MRKPSELNAQLIDKLAEISRIDRFSKQIKAYGELELFLHSIQLEAYEEGLKEGKKKFLSIKEN